MPGLFPESPGRHECRMSIHIEPTTAFGPDLDPLVAKAAAEGHLACTGCATPGQHGTIGSTARAKYC